MRRAEAIAWVVSACAASLRLSQAKTLSILVAAAMRVERASPANVGRAAAGTAKGAGIGGRPATHPVKRCRRFVAGQSPIPAPCANGRVEPADAMRGVARRLVGRRKKPLPVAPDWVDVRGFQTLAASAVLKGRSTPTCRASREGHTYSGHRGRNAFEEGLLLVLRPMAAVKVILPADRGFGRAALAAFRRRQGFSYLIRVGPKVTVRVKGFHGKLPDYPVKKGVAKVLKDVAYRADGAVTQHVVVRWKHGLPEKRDRRRNRRLPADECWFLMTDLPGTAHRLCALYARRMTTEQLFRDHKSKRSGWSLRDTQLKTPQRLDRLLLVLALAYLLLCGLGPIAPRTHKPSNWCSGSKEQCSIFGTGLLMRAKLRASPAQAFAAVLDLTEQMAEKWG